SAGRGAGSGGRNRAGDGGADAGEDRSGAVFDESFERAHGLCHCRSGAASWSARAAGERSDGAGRSGSGRTDASRNRGRDAGGGFEIAAGSYGRDQNGGGGGFPAESGGGAEDQAQGRDDAGTGTDGRYSDRGGAPEDFTSGRRICRRDGKRSGKRA